MSRSARSAGTTRRASDETIAPGSVPASLPASVKDAFDALDTAGIAWCLLRGEDELADRDGDVDLLVAPGDLERAGRALEAIGFIEHRAWGYEPHRFFLRAGEDGRTKLDLVDELRFGPAADIRVPALAGALGRRRQEGGVYRLAPADAFWALLLHVLLDKPSVEEPHRRTLRRLAPAAREDPVPGLFRSATDAEAIIDAVETDRWVEASGLAKTLAPATRGAIARSIARRIGWRLPPLRRRGVTVALLAPDGAGKTTIVGCLTRSFPIPVRSIYMGLYKKPRRRLPPGIGLGARVGLQWTRYARAVYHRRRGRVVLFDRYTDDATLPAGTTTGSRDRFRRRILRGALPRPDLILVLDAPAEELLRRKGEHDLEKLERDRRHYLAVAHASPRAAVLDATRPPDDVARAAAARIWAELVARS